MCVSYIMGDIVPACLSMVFCKIGGMAAQLPMGIGLIFQIHETSTAMYTSYDIAYIRGGIVGECE